MLKAKPIFSEEDKDLCKIDWKLHPDGHAYKGTRKPSRWAHRVVLMRKLGRKLRKGEIADHINRNPLDNRRENLRVGDKALNTINRDIRPDNTTGFTGVYVFHPKQYKERGWKKKYQAQIYRNGQVIFRKNCDTAEEAHRVREEKLN